MSIVRAPRPTTGFTLVSNSTLQDERLSYRARGVLAAILSRPDGWETNSDQLAQQGREGRDAVRAALTELEEAGYLRRERVQNLRGQWVTQTHVFDSPTTDSQASGDQPTTGNQASDNRASVNQALKREGETEEQDLPAEESKADEEPAREDVARLCVLLADLIEQNGSKRPTITKAWLDAARLLIDRDGKTEQQVERVVRWCQADDFWRGNILSMPKLRAKYDQLRLKAMQQGATFAPAPERPKGPPAELLGDPAALERYYDEQIRARRAGVR